MAFLVRYYSNLVTYYKIPQLFDEPQSSAPARALGYFDQIVIFMAVICQCLESLPAIREAESPDQNFWGIMTLVLNLYL